MTNSRRAPERQHLRVGTALALLLHAGLALAFLLVPHKPPRPRSLVEFQVKRPPPPPPPATQPAPPKPEPEPEKKIVKKAERPPEAPRATKTTDKPVEAPKPVFGLQPDETVGDGIALPQGNTTMANPATRPKGPVTPLPAASAPAGKEFHPVAETELKRLPDHDAESCGASMKEKYSTSQAYTEGVEGEVVFRVELDETGKIHALKKIKGLGHGLDEMAMGFLRFNPRCRFGPATGKHGKPAAFVIERYSVIFEAAR